MIVVDMEASGLNPERDSLLSIGAVDFLNPTYQFYGECRVWDGAHINDDALAVNGFTREQCVDPAKQSECQLIEKFLAWASQCQSHTLAGQNVAQDRDFLRAAAHRSHFDWPFAHRTIDLHSITWYHHILHGVTPPEKNKRSDLNLDHILEYVGLPAEPKPHNGLTGAKLEAEAFSRLIYKKNLLKEYSQYEITM